MAVKLGKVANIWRFCFIVWSVIGYGLSGSILANWLFNFGYLYFGYCAKIYVCMGVHYLFIIIITYTSC